MLQMTKLSLEAQEVLEVDFSFPPSFETMEELERETNNWMSRWLWQRKKIARSHGRLSAFIDYIDQNVRTDLLECTDDADVSPERKLRIVRSLHRTNTLFGVYRHYTQILIPLIRQMAAERGRPVRLLELASGSGEMAMHLARVSEKKNLPLEVTASDYVDIVVSNAERKARNRRLKMNFRTINAFDLGTTLGKGQYDIFLIIGTMHHFKPGQLAVMMAQAQRLSDSGALFVGLDVFRSIPLLLFLPTSHLITFFPDHIHDAWLTARKAYSLHELEHIAKIAVPNARISVSHSFPGLSVLIIKFF